MSQIGSADDLKGGWLKFLRNVYNYKFSWRFYFSRPKRKTVYFSTNIHTSHL